MKEVQPKKSRPVKKPKVPKTDAQKIAKKGTPTKKRKLGKTGPKAKKAKVISETVKEIEA
jgi:hypothetical protein